MSGRTEAFRPLRGAGLALAALLAAACGGGEPRRSALLVTLDTTRADAPSCYGETRGVTPFLDRLAAESVLYDRAYTVCPLTLPSHASMLTGLYPLRHTVRVNGRRPLPSAAWTLAEAARAAGVETAAFIAAVVLDDEFGLSQGFDVYDVPERAGDPRTSFFDERPADEVVDSALAWLEERDGDRPFFAWVHLFDPHEPYEPPDELLPRIDDHPRLGELLEQGTPLEVAREIVGRPARYLGEVSFADRELGRLLEALGREGTLDETFVAVVADHGEGLGAHSESTHGDYCWETTLRVPMLLRHPDGWGAGTRSGAIVSVVDVHPTLAEAMDLPLPEPTDGTSLYRRAAPAGRGVYFEAYTAWAGFGWSPVAGWLDAGGKYVHCSQPLFFDLGRDPSETRNLFGEVDVEPYRDAIAAVADLPSLEAASNVEDAQLRERIQALGYAGVEDHGREFPHPLADTGLPSPYERRELHGLIMRGFALVNGGEYAASSEVFARVLEEDPTNHFVLEHHAIALIRQDRFAGALPFLERLVSMGRSNVGVDFNLGVCLDRVGRPEEAIQAFERAYRLAPDDPRIPRHLADLHRAAGREAEALAWEELLGPDGS